MASSIDTIRGLFDDEIRTAESILKAIETNTSAAQLRLTEYEHQEKEALSRLNAVNNELHRAEEELDRTKIETASLRSRAHGEADRVMQEARQEAASIANAFNQAIQQAARNATSKPK